jgi:hypothetical protein
MAPFSTIPHIAMVGYTRCINAGGPHPPCGSRMATARSSLSYLDSDPPPQRGSRSVVTWSSPSPISPLSSPPPRGSVQVIGGGAPTIRVASLVDSSSSTVEQNGVISRSFAPILLVT